MIAEAAPGIEAAHASRGCAFGDFDNYGAIDILIVNMNEPPSLPQRLRRSGNWLKVKLIGVKSNRSAIGARVIARYGAGQQVQEVLSQASYYSSNDRRLHFSLGTETIGGPGNPVAERQSREYQERRRGAVGDDTGKGRVWIVRTKRLAGARAWRSRDPYRTGSLAKIRVIVQRRKAQPSLRQG